MRYFIYSLIPCFLLALWPGTGVRAQEFSGGFRAGLNFVTFDGDQEMDMDGMTLEDFRRTTGFHVAATFALAFTDLVGVKGDLMYTQKGGEVIFEGPSYFYLYNGDDDREGQRLIAELESERDVVNSYIDVPVVAYYRIGPVELEGGVSAGFLINSRASGSAIYRDLTDFSGRLITDQLTVNYDYNYFEEERIGGAGIVETSSTPLTTSNLPGGNTFPPDVINAYYNAEDETPLYRRLDFGLVAGVSVFLNNGLYIGARYQYGLTDVTRPDNDRRIYAEADTRQREYNPDDKDYNRVIQASVGFRF